MSTVLKPWSARKGDRVRVTLLSGESYTGSLGRWNKNTIAVCPDGGDWKQEPHEGIATVERID